MKIISRSAAQTKKIAADLAKKILDTSIIDHRPSSATVVALCGDLGAGKTTFTQGFAKALGIKHRMLSPTFLIFRKYDIKKNLQSSRPEGRGSPGAAIFSAGGGSAFGGNFQFFYHVDLYRIHSAEELSILGFKKILHSPFNILLIEWAEKIKKILPKDTIWVQFEHGEKENERIVIMK